MDFLSGLGSINFEVIFQLLFVGLIMIAGPIVVFILAFRGGDL
ncbi:MAG: photosystem II reaction center protein Ycf12 [Spirulina sp. SIO3F2]|nr:photosystem II reaction center protein Ycf12 [Spirulina sp. SIO3F2]